MATTDVSRPLDHRRHRAAVAAAARYRAAFRSLEALARRSRPAAPSSSRSRCGASTRARAARSSTCSTAPACGCSRTPPAASPPRDAVAHRQARPRGVRDRLGQARGDRRRAYAAARRPGAARGRRGAGRRRLHGPAVHERRPDPRAPAGGRRLRRGDAARLADRLRHGPAQPLQPRADPRARRRAGDPRRRASAPRPTPRSRWSSATTACCARARSRAPRTPSRWRARSGSAPRAGGLAYRAGRSRAACTRRPPRPKTASPSSK